MVEPAKQQKPAPNTSFTYWGMLRILPVNPVNRQHADAHIEVNPDLPASMYYVTLLALNLQP